MSYYILGEIRELEEELEINYEIRDSILRDMYILGLYVYCPYLEYELYLIERKIRRIKEDIKYFAICL